MKTPLSPEHMREITRFASRIAIFATVLAALPWIVAIIVHPAGSIYIGSQFATDDQMVYAAWIHQAMHGRFLFDNRFAVESQPGLTVHLYFWLLGVLAMPFKSMPAYIVIPAISNIARLFFTWLFVRLLSKLCIELQMPVFVAKVGLALACFGGGIGFLVWEQFGRLTRKGGFVSGLSESRLPIDVWQPEAFTFPSMLVNGLFLASLCLIVTVFLMMIRARESWRAAAIGAPAMLLLMNIHSYDVLIVLFVMVAFAATLIRQHQITRMWAVRAFVIGLGAIPAALWYGYVISRDPVFQARAATLTYSPTFRQVVLGIFPLFLLALYAFAAKRQSGDEGGQIPASERFPRWWSAAGLVLLSLLLFLSATGYDPEKTYFVGWPGFAAMLVGAIALVTIAARESLAWNFFTSWATVGLMLPFLPQLFQRKLAMGLAIPWGFVAAYGLLELLRLLKQGSQTQEGFRRNRNMVAAVAVIVCQATSIFWLQRELMFIRDNISSTTMQPIFLTSDVGEILRILDRQSDRTVVIARPGVAVGLDDGGFASYLPDLNPLVSGFAGSYSYAGHWSETPGYDEKRHVAEGIFRPLPPDQIAGFLRESQPDFLIQPIPEAFPDLPSGSLEGIGSVEFEGRQFRLIRVDKSAF